MKKYFPLLLITVLVCSCAVKERHYRRGFFVDWASGLSKTATPEEKKKSIRPTSKRAPIQTIHARSPYDTIFCDTVFLMNGTKRIVKVMEVIKNNQVNLKKCGAPDSMIERIPVDSIYRIKYADETVLNMRTYEPMLNLYGLVQEKYLRGEKKYDKNGKKKKIHPAAWIMLGLLILLPLGFIVSIIAGNLVAQGQVKRIRYRSEKYRGLNIIRVCLLIFTIPAVIIWFLIVLLWLLLVTGSLNYAF